MRFGAQVDIDGIIAPSADADRAIRYLTKYLTKSVADTYAAPEGADPDAAYEAHIDRLWSELQAIPCSPECSVWLRYGMQPKDAGLVPVPGRPARPSPTTASTSASAAVGSRSPVPGPARP